MTVSVPDPGEEAGIRERRLEAWRLEAGGGSGDGDGDGMGGWRLGDWRLEAGKLEAGSGN